MLEGRIEATMEEDRRGTSGILLLIWVPCYNKQFKKSNKLETETDEEYKKRKLEWQHLHIGDVQITQSD